MPNLYTTIGPWTFPTFNLFLGLAVLVSAGVGLRRVARMGAHPGAVADVYLGALIGAIVGARLFHVLLNWDYFADATNEITLISLGGLDWHGAVVGGVIGLYAVYQIRHFIRARLGLSPTEVRALHVVTLQFSVLLDMLTPALPLLGLAGWWGCLAALCGYGAEVDNLSRYPAFAAAETADVYGIVVPRYNTQVFGLILSACVLLIVVLLFWRGWLCYRRFWLTLTVLSAGMFAIGFFRGDHAVMLLGLRADQILDALFAAESLAIGGWLSRRGTPINYPNSTRLSLKIETNVRTNVSPDFPNL
jgi:phosphatidylglycerol:prolipoprotein diacylglycerol transferase